MFFLFYSLVWVMWFGAIVVFQAYEIFTEWHYLAVGLGMALPVFLLPLAADEVGPSVSDGPFRAGTANWCGESLGYISITCAVCLISL